MVTAGIFSIMWIYAMANCATGIAYVVIGCCELMLVAGIIAPQLSEGEEANKMAASVVGIILFIVFNVILYCKWKNIKIAIAVIDATADFFMNTARINLVSAMYFMLTAIWFVIWLALVIGMLGIAEYNWEGRDTVTHQERSMDTSGAEIEGYDTIKYMVYFMCFTLIWVIMYLKDSNVFVLMASVSTYYFDSNA